MTINDEQPADADTNGNGADAAPPTYKYDVAVSFAGEQRTLVEAVVRAIDLPPGRVFYDADYTPELWGEDLAELFTRLYSKEARYVVMFISREYARKEWARVERRAALARRMRTQAAYILPVRCDTTELEDVDGLLNTIGYLNGVQLGAQGVADVLNRKLGTVLAESDTAASAVKPEIAQITHDAAGLMDLLQRRPHSWQWAAFGSVLVQRRAALQGRIRDHHLGYANPTGERIADVSELYDLVRNSLRDVEQLGHQLRDLVITPAFMAAFGEPNNLADDPEAIVHVANRVMDFYERHLQLAQRVRGVSAPADYINLLDSCARLSDMPLAGMDEFIDEYEKLVGQMPDLLIDAGEEVVVHPVTLKINVDGEVTGEVLRQFAEILDRDS
jgi:hypothetical protein